MRFSNSLKKLLVASGIAIPLCFLNIANLRAASPDYLALIAQNTSAILSKVNNIPAYINSMLTFALNLQTVDSSDETANMQANFDVLGQIFSQNISQQNALQQQIMADIVNKSVSDFNSPAEHPPILDALPNVNDISYASLMGAKPVLKGSFTPYNYIKAASGANFKHFMPRPDWSNPNAANNYQPAYFQYYNTVTAVESFGAYALSNLVVESQNNNQTTSLQNALTTQASNSNWTKKVASETVGEVLRQILLFQSQTYVLLTQLVQTQKQLLTASIMTNSLLIANNRMNEIYITSKAQGVMPQG